MDTDITIHTATVNDVQKVAMLVDELLTEITHAIGVQAFNYDLEVTSLKLKDLIEQKNYFVFVARNEQSESIGLLTLYESYALYAGGTFGTIPELYVRPDYRSNKVGLRLLSHAKEFADSKGWSRLEVTTPPLPQFDKTLAFYVREGFSITGGRKLKMDL
ncbi:MAG: GNAT family N-acetyltransferase [Candidatus Thiodiazotropha sp. (ex Ctena orbiculata)]|nr:GNAT family N-acetyltransferase [Candidatus Thiodiazotropha taylori]